MTDRRASFSLVLKTTEFNSIEFNSTEFNSTEFNFILLNSRRLSSKYLKYILEWAGWRWLKVMNIKFRFDTSAWPARYSHFSEMPATCRRASLSVLIRRVVSLPIGARGRCCRHAKKQVRKDFLSCLFIGAWKRV